jgi:chromosome segregation ATPase
MPLGLWKSKWVIHREDMEQRGTEHRQEMDRQREKTERFFAEMRAERAKSDERWAEVREECRELRTDYDRELAETRLFNRELLVRMEKTYGNLGTTLHLMGDEMIAMRGEIHELKHSVDAQTAAILKLVDRFEDPGGRPPV